MEEVILVNENDEQTGIMEKMEVHEKGLLHRAFSIFIFDNEGRMLLQQRANRKYHSPGLWTNACCSHPRPGESIHKAAQRRLQEELGFGTELQEIFDFIYKASFDNGLTEHEYDHVYTGTYTGIIRPNLSEVLDYCYKPMDDIQQSLQSHPHKYTVWFGIAFSRILDWWKLRYAA